MSKVVGIDRLLAACELRVPSSTVRAIGNGTIQLCRQLPTFEGSFFGRAYDRTRIKIWQDTEAVTACSLVLYANTDNAPTTRNAQAEQLGPAALAVVRGEDTGVENMLPYTQYIFRPKAFRGLPGTRTPARLIVVRGLVDVAADTHLHKLTTETRIEGTVNAGEAMPNEQDFADLEDILQSASRMD